MKFKVQRVSNLPDGEPALERAMGRFWKNNEIEFPWSFNLHLCVNDMNRFGRVVTDSRKHWMRERHGEAAKILRSATRIALACNGR